MEPRPASTMIATLGGQPQVITFALDALLNRGEQIVEVVVLHLAPPRIRAPVTPWNAWIASSPMISTPMPIARSACAGSC